MELVNALFEKHKGQRIVVMGGGPTLEQDIAGLDADVWISVNEQGAALRPVDYVVVTDRINGRTKRPMLETVRTHTDAPVISDKHTVDYLIAQWPLEDIGLSGVLATWVAWLMGGKPVILAGFTDFSDHWAARYADKMAGGGPIRVVGGRMTTWPAYDPDEALPRYAKPRLDAGPELLHIRANRRTHVGSKKVPEGGEFFAPRHVAERYARLGIATILD